MTVSTSSTPGTTGSARDASRSGGIDPRGPRFVASVTLLVLAVALVAAPSTLTVVLVAAQAVVFAIGAGLGIQRTPYSWVFRTLVRPRLAPPAELEDPAPPRFAQGVGLGFALVALVGYVTGATLLGSVATGFALAAAFLNAVFGFCLGCELYLLGRRLAPARAN
ncbi:DUF4395 domain-containing protein [Nocardioides iriomotensis]|uniref:DUF4395 domain-containing protein n=1 Tax=Nocardioides iriomotensis TaxID=715784 RepID=A0A4Q5IZT0_9ACTN|nr:DUF4395 domain-containing protein [Nocardioides iriomotensis]RYU10599.1 DUF4395 domain-containing protein [Nocardioides iriomotensis]